VYDVLLLARECKIYIYIKYDDIKREQQKRFY